MLKRRILIILIILLSISLIIVLIKYKEVSAESNWKQNNANIEFKGDLDIASSFFEGDYNRAMSMIASASQIYNFTTYSKSNKDLSTILNYLYNLMDNNKYKGAIIKKSYSMFEVLSQLSQNPEDKKATDNLYKLTIEIGESK